MECTAVKPNQKVACCCRTKSINGGSVFPIGMHAQFDPPPARSVSEPRPGLRR